MEELEECIRDLRAAVESGTRDHSLLRVLEQCVQNLELREPLIDWYCRTLFGLYDLSNSPKLIQGVDSGELHYDDLALLIKECWLDMLGLLIVFYNDHPQAELPRPLLKEALELMVLVCRVLIDSGRLTAVMRNHHLAIIFHGANYRLLESEYQLIHHLNTVEVRKIQIENNQAHVKELAASLSALQQLCEQCQAKEYTQLMESIVFETTLKLLKKSRPEEAKILRPYLSPEMQQSLDDLGLTDNKLRLEGTNSPLEMSHFYEFYLKIKEDPNIISENFLRSFISKPQNMSDSRLFDVVALTEYTPALVIWFENSTSIKGTVSTTVDACHCFNYLIDKFVQHLLPNGLQDSLQSQLSQKDVEVDKYVELSRAVMMVLLSEKKDSQVPLLAVMKRLVKVAICMVISLYSNHQYFKKHCQHLQLICSKFSLADLSRSISCLSFYYELLMGNATQAGYQQFCRACLLDKHNQVYKSIQMIYDLRSGNSTLSRQEKLEVVARHPMTAILFDSNNSGAAVLTLSHSEFMKMSERYEAYFMLAHKYSEQEQLQAEPFEELLDHLDQTLSQQDFSRLTPHMVKYIQLTQEKFMEILVSRKEQLECRLTSKMTHCLMYLVSLTYFSQELKSFSTGLILNRYSKLLKLLSLAFGYLEISRANKEDSVKVMLYLAKQSICSSLELCKAKSLKGEQPSQPGLVVLCDMLFEFITNHQQCAQTIRYLKFVRFELNCLCGKADIDLSAEDDPNLLKMFCGSAYVSRAVKHQIQRRLLREDKLGEGRHISLPDLHELIESAESVTQKSVYAQQMARLYGEDGLMFLKLQASKHPQLYEFLSHQEDEEL